MKKRDLRRYPYSEWRGAEPLVAALLMLGARRGGKHAIMEFGWPLAMRYLDSREQARAGPRRILMPQGVDQRDLAMKTLRRGVSGRSLISKAEANAVMHRAVLLFINAVMPEPKYVVDSQGLIGDAMGIPPRPPVRTDAQAQADEFTGWLLDTWYGRRGRPGRPPASADRQRMIRAEISTLECAASGRRVTDSEVAQRVLLNIAREAGRTDIGYRERSALGAVRRAVARARRGR